MWLAEFVGVLGSGALFLAISLTAVATLVGGAQLVRAAVVRPHSARDHELPGGPEARGPGGTPRRGELP